MEPGDCMMDRSIKRSIALAALICARVSMACAAYAQNVTVQLDPAQTQIHWTLPTVLHIVHGTFQLNSGMMTFNAQTGAALGLFQVNEDTGQSGDNVRDGRMKKSILKTTEYPAATFQPKHVSGAFHASGPSTLVVDGIFHLYGADHPLQLNFQVNTTGSAMTATTKFDIPYVAWGMHDPSTLFLRVDKSVQMEIDAKGSIQSSK